MSSPCDRDCPKRTPVCHSTCFKYKKWAIETRKKNKEKNEHERIDRATANVGKKRIAEGRAIAYKSKGDN